jgi:hypothetical protein
VVCEHLDASRRADLATELGAADQLRQTRAPLLGVRSQETILAQANRLRKSRRWACDGRHPDKRSLDVLDLALGLAERPADLERRQVDVERGERCR